MTEPNTIKINNGESSEYSPLYSDYDFYTHEITGTTTFNGQIGSDFVPDGDNTRTLGSSTKRFSTLHSAALNTGDINMENENGKFTLDEQAEYIRVYNHRNGKYYKLVMEELDE